MTARILRAADGVGYQISIDGQRLPHTFNSRGAAQAGVSTERRRAARAENQARIELEIKHGKRCPDCASEDTESNGSSEYRCRECDHRWGFEGGRSGEPYGFC